MKILHKNLRIDQSKSFKFAYQVTQSTRNSCPCSLCSKSRIDNKQIKGIVSTMSFSFAKENYSSFFLNE